MKVTFTLSSKTDNSGMSEILLRTVCRINGKPSSMRAKSSIFISKDYFSDKDGIKSLSNRHVETPDVKYHKEQTTKLSKLIDHITMQYQQTDRDSMQSNWLSDVVDRYNYPEKYAPKEDVGTKFTFYELMDKYLKEKRFSTDFYKGHKVLMRAISRYEGFIRETDNKDFTFDVDAIDRETISDFSDYLRNEKQLSEEYKELFNKLLKSYPAIVGRGYNAIVGRGDNDIIKIMKKLKAFFKWLNDTKYTENRPFENFTIGSERFGTPFYISIDERNTIARTEMPSKHLETQRDIFVFQCLIGCRVGDLVKLTSDNITDGVLHYAPRKTKDEGSQATVARVPLIDEAVALIVKYKGTDKKGRLFPFISAQKYNDAIKEIFTKAGITRNVEVRNALTGEMEIKPINEIASSHLARRTFCGNLYFKVQDPNLIGQMSGHVEGSKAFSRYRKIETETLKDVVNLLK